MYRIRPTTKFQKDVKRLKKRGYELSSLTKVIQILADGKNLPPQNRDHALSGNYAGFRECHIAPDWLLIYEISEDTLFLYLTRTGSHSDLF
jgi:mRNA interferase YafQ